jgi:D-sedoheptulose 7-phosphate isomerase
MSLPVAILAGGLATRLRGVAGDVPKSLVEVAGQPFAVHQIDMLVRHGLTDIVFCVGHRGEEIAAALGDGRRWGARLRYSFDGPALLGTGGALRHALPMLGDAFLVLYGDSYLDCDYQAIARAFCDSGREGLMTVYRNEGRWDASNVQYAAGRIVRYDKARGDPAMRHIDYGLGALRASAFEIDHPPDQPLDLAALYQSLLERGQLAGYEVAVRFFEIGGLTGLEETRRHLEDRAASGGYVAQHLAEAAQILAGLDHATIERMATLLSEVRDRGGRLFFLGVGGSAANCSHAVNDFRKIAGFEAYTPTDNVSELTARTNDEGWESVFVGWLKGSRLRADDAVFVLSVGGGSLEQNVSPNLVRALQYARDIGARVLGIVGRDGGYTAKIADACLIVPTVNAATVTPHTEAFQPMVWHLLVSHPALKVAETKWESTG